MSIATPYYEHPQDNRTVITAECATQARTIALHVVAECPDAVDAILTLRRACNGDTILHQCAVDAWYQLRDQ